MTRFHEQVKNVRDKSNKEYIYVTPNLDWEIDDFRDFIWCIDMGYLWQETGSVFEENPNHEGDKYAEKFIVENPVYEGEEVDLKMVCGCQNCDEVVDEPVELKEYNGVMLPKYIDGREVLSYPNAGAEPVEEIKITSGGNPSQEAFMSKYQPKHDLCHQTYLDGVYTHDKDIKVGDVVSISKGWGRYSTIYEVSRLTKCFIVFMETEVIKSDVRDTGGDIYTFSKYIGRGCGNIEMKRKITGKTGEYDGYKVYDKTKPIWVQTGQTDIWA